MHRIRVLLIAAGLVVCASGCLPTWAVEPGAAGTVTIPTTIDSTGRTDVSVPMAQFFASVPDSSTVELTPNGIYRMESTLLLTKRHNLTIHGNGAMFKVTSPANRTRSNVRVMDSSNIAFTNLRIKGANPNAGMSDAAFVSAKEAQHGIEAKSVAGFVLSHVTITDTYGDFVYLSRNEEHPWTSDVLITDSTFLRNGRQGITITAARNVVIQNNTMDQMRRATFDLEAHYANFGADGVTIKDNHIGQGRLYLIAAVGIARIDHLTLQGNTVARPMEIRLDSEDGSTNQDWKILDNTSSVMADNLDPAVMHFNHLDGLEVHGNRQIMDPRIDMVGAIVTNSCNVSLDGNDYPNAVSQGTVTGTC